MSLFVRLEAGFWTHRKTMRLRALIGDAALWLPPRLWSYAAQNQPDGDFSNYMPEELAMLLGYTSNAQAMLGALQQSGFMDEMKVHDWQEYNGYHRAFAERAKKAAAARWKGVSKTERKGEEKRREEGSNASSIANASKSKGSVEEIAAFCLEQGLPASDGEACFHKWQGNGWKNGNAPIKCWKSTVRSWKAAGYMPSQKNPKVPSPSQPAYWQPDGPDANTPLCDVYRRDILENWQEGPAKDRIVKMMGEGQ